MVQSSAAIAAPLILSLLFSGVQAAPSPGTQVGNGRTRPRGVEAGNSGFRMRAAGYGPHFLASQGAAAAGSNSTEIIGNSQDLLYTVNVTINGLDLPVQIDTGSTDLWVYAPSDIKVNNETDIEVTESYGKGHAKGPIAFADIELGKYHIQNQGEVIPMCFCLNILTISKSFPQRQNGKLLG